MTTPTLELREITVRRGPAIVLDRVSLEVAPGTVHALVGPNGAGKSTLLAVALGLVDFEGTAKLNLRGSGRIGYVPQRFDSGDRFPLTVAELAPLTVAELLALERQRWPVCLGVRASARARIAPTLARVGLSGFESRRVDRLSGGERQRVLLAHALEPAPELLLLDEPASGLDASSRDTLESVLQSAKNEGAAVLMVSHDAEQVARLADHVTRLAPTGAA